MSVESISKMYPDHKWVFDGINSMDGTGMYHCKRCGKSDVTVSGEQWERDQINFRIADLEKREGCKPK
jgi:hypothetical protein